MMLNDIGGIDALSKPESALIMDAFEAFVDRHFAMLDCTRVPEGKLGYVSTKTDTIMRVWAIAKIEEEEHHEKRRARHIELIDLLAENLRELADTVVKQTSSPPAALVVAVLRAQFVCDKYLEFKKAVEEAGKEKSKS